MNNRTTIMIALLAIAMMVGAASAGIEVTGIDAIYANNSTESPAVDSYTEEEQHVKEITMAHEKQLERIKQMPRTSDNLYVYVYEYYWYDIGPNKLIKESIPSMHISFSLYDTEVDEVTVDLRLPVGTTPEYSYGDIPEEIRYNDVTGELSLTYDTSDITDEYVWTDFNLPGLDGENPFVTVPTVNATPSYCAPFESKEVTLSLSPAVMKEAYDWGYVQLEVSDVNTTEITDITPEASHTYDGSSYAYAYWYYYDFDELAEHVMDVYIENDIDEVDTRYGCNVEKYTGTNVEILSVTTSPSVTVSTSNYTYIGSDVHFDLDPTNYTEVHGFLEGTAYNEFGEVLSGAEVRISGMDFYLYKITDENGKYSVMLPPWVYSISADYGYVAYDDEYESEYYDVFVTQDTTTTQDLTLYKVPTVKMEIEPIDDDLTGGEISYSVIIENTGSKTESISLYGYDSVYNSTGYYIYDVLEWTFSDDYFDLDPGETKVVIADAGFVGTEPLDWGKYAFKIYCYPESDDIQGYYYLRDFFEVHGALDITVIADKDVYMIGEAIYLETSITSYEESYNIDFGIDVGYSDEGWNYANLTGLYYPAYHTWNGWIPIAIPTSKLMPPGDYEFIVWVRDSTTGQLIGEGSDTVSISHGKGIERMPIKSFG